MANIFDAMSPIFLATKFVGLAPFRLDVKKKLFNVSVSGLIYSGLMLLLFVASAGFYTYIMVVRKSRMSDSYMLGTEKDAILLFCDVTVTICTILFAVVQRHKYVKVVHYFYNVGFEMAKINEHVSYKDLFKYSRLHLLIFFLVMFFLFIQLFFQIEREDELIMACIIYIKFAPQMYNFLMELQFVSATLLLKIHYSLLNKSLGKLNEFQENVKEPNKVVDTGINENAWMDNLELQKNNKVMAQTFAVWEGNLSKFRTRKVWTTEKTIDSTPIFLDKIKTIRKIHSNLCEIKEYLNSAFSIQLLASVAQSFVAITANLYMIFTSLSSANYDLIDLISFAMWSLMHTVELVIVVVSCTLTSTTANYTAVLVHKLLARDCPIEIRNQLKLFSIQLLHRKISFTASGFFSLDMTLLQGVMGAATTYLVILIQFHNSDENLN